MPNGNSNIVSYSDDPMTSQLLGQKNVDQGGEFNVVEANRMEYAKLCFWIAGVIRGPHPNTQVHVIGDCPRIWRLSLRRLVSRFGGIVPKSQDKSYWIITESRRRRDEFPKWAEDVELPFLGNPRPTVLLVGEGPAKRAVTPWPFNIPEGSSPVLHQALGARDDVAMINASDVAVDPRLFHLLLMAQAERDPWSSPTRIIALGTKAVRQMGALGIQPDAAIVHPSYARRFQAGKLDLYAEALAQAIEGRPVGGPPWELTGDVIPIEVDE